MAAPLQPKQTGKIPAQASAPIPAEKNTGRRRLPRFSLYRHSFKWKKYFEQSLKNCL
jgi:hypothetical protein